MSRDIALNLIDPDPGQPRQTFDENGIQELAQSMEAKGLIIPIMVRPVGDRFVIVHGERRYRAAKLLDWETIPAEVRDVSPEEARWLSLIENVQRQDLSPIEEARAYRERLAEGITQEELGKRIGKSRTYITQKLRLLKLPDPIVFYLDKRAIGEGHARQLMRLKGMYVKELPVEFNQVGEPPADWDGASSMLRAIRPEDNTFCWFAEKDGINQGLITEGCVSFWKYIMANNWTIPQWEIAAFWWACMVVYTELSVARLSRALDNWEKRFLTALWWVDCHGESHEPEGKPFKDKRVSELIDDIMWWGYRSDIRHSNACELSSTDVLEQIAKHHIIGGMSGDQGYILPSCCQAWGFQRQEYLALLRTADEKPSYLVGALMKETKSEAKRKVSALKKLQDWNEQADEFLDKIKEQLFALDERLGKASTLTELLNVIDNAEKLEYEVAEWRLRGERAAGQVLTELENVSRDTSEAQP